MVNLCRDEVTATLKHKIDQVFGSSFNTNGLGGVLTCGVTGVGAGLSHAPVSATSGKERYVFFSFPHVSINARGTVGAISRPGRPEPSCACGALHQALVDIKTTGLTSNCKIPGVHEPLDPGGGAARWGAGGCRLSTSGGEHRLLGTGHNDASALVPPPRPRIHHPQAAPGAAAALRGHHR